MERITVLIPTYNREQLLKRSLISIALQSYQDIDVIIYDDGSTDNTEKMVETLTEPSIRYHKSDTNMGVAYARNKLMNLCSTRLAVWQDSDDIANNFRIEELYTFMGITNCPVVNSCFDRIDNTNRRYHRPGYVDINWHFAKRGGGATCMFQVDKAIEFDETLKAGEDSCWRDKMNKKYGREYLLQKVLYYVDFGRHERLSRKFAKEAYRSR